MKNTSKLFLILAAVLALSAGIFALGKFAGRQSSQEGVVQKLGSQISQDISEKIKQIMTNLKPGNVIIQPELTCKKLWWFDSKNRTCQQRQFCGMFMYSGLRTFDTESACQEALKENPSAECQTDEDCCYQECSQTNSIPPSIHCDKNCSKKCIDGKCVLTQP